MNANTMKFQRAASQALDPMSYTQAEEIPNISDLEIPALQNGRFSSCVRVLY
jgi:hypothetical protein